MSDGTAESENAVLETVFANDSMLTVYRVALKIGIIFVK